MKNGNGATSKRLAWVIIAFYIIAFFSVEYSFVRYGKDLFQLFGSILPIPMTVILSYFGKAGFENCYKISQNGTTLDQTVDSKAIIAETETKK